MRSKFKFNKILVSVKNNKKSTKELYKDVYKFYESNNIIKINPTDMKEGIDVDSMGVEKFLSSKQTKRYLNIELTKSQIEELENYFTYTNKYNINYSIKTLCNILNEGINTRLIKRMNLLSNLKSADGKINFIIMYGYEKGYKIWKTKKSDRIIGDKNPIHNVDVVTNPYSRDFVGYKDLSDEEIDNKIKEMKIKCKKSYPNYRRTNNKQYWINKGYTEEEAIAKVRERQITFSKEKCIAKYGKTEGLKVWKERQYKWQKSLKNNNDLDFINAKKSGVYKYLIEELNFSKNKAKEIVMNFDLEDIKNYNREVVRLSNITYNKYKNEIDPDNLRGKEHGYDLDHKFSRIIGYILNVPEKIMSSKYNLDIITAYDNDSKSHKCTISLEELTNLYKSNEN